MASSRWRLERSQHVIAPVAEVFAFFAEPANLERITPPTLRFRIVSPLPVIMRDGATIDYRLRLHGAPLRWRSRIDAYEPPVAFTDVQVIGPYRSWVHRHRFAAVGGGTEITDVVDYEIALGGVGRLVHRWLVRNELQRIFDYRRDAIAGIFAR